MCRVTNRCKIGARLCSCPPTTRQDTNRVILYGQSIGGADLAYPNPQAITAVIVDNTFVSLPRLITSAMPWLGPSSFLCHQKWESYLKAPKLPLTMPMPMLGRLRDEVVLRSQMSEPWAITHNRGRGDDAAAAGSKKSPGSARGSSRGQ